MYVFIFRHKGGPNIWFGSLLGPSGAMDNCYSYL